MIISADDLNSRLLAHCKDRMFRQSDLQVTHAEKNISRLDSGVGCRAARVDILKYPSLSERCFGGEVGRAQRSPAGCSTGAAVKEPRCKVCSFLGAWFAVRELVAANYDCDQTGDLRNRAREHCLESGKSGVEWRLPKSYTTL